MTRNLIVLVLALGVLLAGSFFSVQAVRADTDTGMRFPLVESLAERLGLSEDEVTTALEDVREERRVQVQERKEDGLDEAVADGVITGEQKQTLLEQQQEKWEGCAQHHEEMQEWMEDSGIDFESLREYGYGGRFGGGFGGHGKGF